MKTAPSLSVAGLATGRVAFTTDSYVVSPLFFPGGDIGSLAVHGTINDLAMAGAQPLCLSLASFSKKGLEIGGAARRSSNRSAAAAAAAGVTIVTGDTKVVPRGKADRLFINTSGIGLVAEGVSLSAARVRPGDRVLLSGSIGDHGMAVMLAREALEIEADIRSDSAPLHRLVADVLAAAPGDARASRIRRVAAWPRALNEMARQAGVAIAIDERRVPVRADVRARLRDARPGSAAHRQRGKAHRDRARRMRPTRALDAMRVAPARARRGDHRRGAATSPRTWCCLKTEVGGSRVLDMLVGDPLPRIC